ncbi:DUF7319 domain-containing protein [Haloarchaeobius salinus]|uniref:DUF7319 domain-containing protein n=1 Tax=Haloarchaeobius salinus TaxID=1198298 RepID=UPI00210C111F|nr:hypothetical protein [Haloarchaeobius salinus]
MTDAGPSRSEGEDEQADRNEAAGSTPAEATESTDAVEPSETEQLSDEELRRQVEEKYDFDDFGPAEMAEMSYEEWDAAFDPETWIVGEELLDRVEQDLNAQIASRDVFAVIERVTYEGEEVLLAYSDEGYAMVFPDGSIDGFGTVLRDVKPTVALCSMDEYEPTEPPAEAVLPHPDEIPEGSGQLGNNMLQVVATTLLLGALGLVAGAFLATGNAGDDLARGIMIVMAMVFAIAGVALFLTVANARLSDRFRAEEYRDRLRAIGLEDGERPSFLPVEPEGDPRESVGVSDTPDSES